jgi:hypothetical protein
MVRGEVEIRGPGNMKKGSSSGTVVVEQTIKSGKEKTPCFTLE